MALTKLKTNAIADDAVTTDKLADAINTARDANTAKVSLADNEQHHPDKPLHWDKSKSTDHLDALARHLVDADKVDDHGLLHLGKVAWRSLAALQDKLENM